MAAASFRLSLSITRGQVECKWQKCSGCRHTDETPAGNTGRGLKTEPQEGRYEPSRWMPFETCHPNRQKDTISMARERSSNDRAAQTRTLRCVRCGSPRPRGARSDVIPRAPSERQTLPAASLPAADLCRFCFWRQYTSKERLAGLDHQLFRDCKDTQSAQRGPHP
jgi:ribosomal protein S14